MFSVWGISLHLYGLLVALGLFVAVSVIQKLAVREGFTKDFVWDAVTWVALSALVGARLYHVVDLWKYYAQNPSQIIAVWQGGIGIFGAIAGGALGLLVFAYHRKLDQKKLRKMFDLAALGLPLGQAIARWGNYFNQELYGAPTNLPWKIFIDPVHRITGYELVAYYHPLFLYESLLNLSLFGFLYGVFQGIFPVPVSIYRYIDKSKRIGSGLYVGVYLMGYGAIRFGLEFIRLEKWTLGGIPTAQMVSVIMMMFGFYLVYNSLKEKNE